MLLAGASGAGGYWFYMRIWTELPSDLTSLRDYRPPTTCVIYAADGQPVDEFYIQRRVWVPIDELPDIVWQAFVAAEDSRFMVHRGIDPQGIARAMIKNILARGVREGGSTITQQLVKNLLVGSERSYIRKLKEAVLAIRLERELAKRELLELYLNYIYLGAGNYGVDAAATDYFGVSARDLSAGQAAVLAGLVRAPSRYSPRRNPDLAELRRNYVLERMVEDGYISPAEASAARVSIEVPPREPSHDLAVGVGYITEVRREIRRIVGWNTAVEQGLRVHTALDLQVQKEAEQALRDALHAIDERHGRRGPIDHLPADRRREFLEHGPGLARVPGSDAPAPPRRGDCFPAMVGDKGLDDLRAGERVYWLYPDDRQVMIRGKDRAVQLDKTIQPGDVLRVCLTGGSTVELDPSPWAEGAAVVIENATGRVLALVGGYHDTLEGFVRATQARRQPGSSFKPYVYATALASGRTQTDRVYDGPIAFPAGGGRIWQPKNFSNRYAGAVTIRYALSRSLNTVAVRLTRDLGVRRVIQTAHSLGVTTPLPSNLTISLGSGVVTPMDQALGYATIARMGVPTEPVYIDYMNNVLGERMAASGEDILVGEEIIGRLPGGPRERALDAGVAYEMADMMREVVRAGTGRRAFVEGLDRAGKTGTTNDSIDAWFVGFTPRHTVAVWVGSDTNESLGDGETGGKAALPAWLHIMDYLPHAEGERFVMPDEAALIRTEGLWMGYPRGEVPDTRLPRSRVSTAPLEDFPGVGG